jgi:hypothetical protein
MLCKIPPVKCEHLIVKSYVCAKTKMGWGMENENKNL